MVDGRQPQASHQLLIRISCSDTAALMQPMVKAVGGWAPLQQRSLNRHRIKGGLGGEGMAGGGGAPVTAAREF